MFKHLHQLSARRLFFNGGCQSSHASKKSSHTSKKSSHASKISGCSSLSSFVNSECNNDFKHLNFFQICPGDLLVYSRVLTHKASTYGELKYVTT